MKSKGIHLDYKWVMVFISGLMVFCTLGFCSSANGIYIAPITSALGISRSAYSLTTTVRYITTSAVNMFFGVLISRFGDKKLILTGFTSLIISVLICSFADNVVLLCVGSMFLGIGLSFTTTTMVGTITNKWCSSNQGTVMGIILSANGVGAALARVILTPIINSQDSFGYRNAYRLVAVILAFVALIMLIFFKSSSYDGVKGKETEKIAEIDKNDKSVFKSPHFYIALICIFLTGLVLQSISNIADPHFRDRSVNIGLITVIMGIHSVVLSVSKFTTGFLYDKFGLRVSSSLCYGAAILSMISLIFVGNSDIGSFFGFGYGVLSSAALPLETVMLPIFVRELFAKEDYNKVLGIFVSVNVAGYAVGAPIANLVFDITGSYDAWIYISMAVIVLIFTAMNLLISSEKKNKAALTSDKSEKVLK